MKLKKSRGWDFYYVLYSVSTPDCPGDVIMMTTSPLHWIA